MDVAEGCVLKKLTSKSFAGKELLERKQFPESLMCFWDVKGFANNCS